MDISNLQAVRTSLYHALKTINRIATNPDAPPIFTSISAQCAAMSSTIDKLEAGRAKESNLPSLSLSLPRFGLESQSSARVVENVAVECIESLALAEALALEFEQTKAQAQWPLSKAGKEEVEEEEEEGSEELGEALARLQSHQAMLSGLLISLNRDGDSPRPSTSSKNTPTPPNRAPPSPPLKSIQSPSLNKRMPPTPVSRSSTPTIRQNTTSFVALHGQLDTNHTAIKDFAQFTHPKRANTAPAQLSETHHPLLHTKPLRTSSALSNNINLTWDRARLVKFNVPTTSKTREGGKGSVVIVAHNHNNKKGHGTRQSITGGGKANWSPQPPTLQVNFSRPLPPDYVLRRMNWAGSRRLTFTSLLQRRMVVTA